MGEWLVLFFGLLVPELYECFLDVIWHVQVYLSFVVVPFHVNANVSFPCPICGDFVVFFECVFEVICMFFSNIFYSEVIDHECELYWSCLVTPESWDEFALMISVFVESFFEEFVCEEACLWESVHAFDHLKVDETFRCDFFSEFVFLYDFVGQVVELYADVFWAYQWCHEIEV